MVLGAQSPGRVGRRPFLSKGPAEGPFVVLMLGARSFSRQSGSSSRSRRTRSPSGGCVTKSAARPSLGERVRRVERLGRRRWPRTRRAPSPARAAAARPRGRAASRTARRRAGRPRTRASARAAGARTTAASGPSTKRSARWSAAADPRQLDDRTSRATTATVCTQHVAVPEVRELVRDDALELGRRRDAEQPDRDRERRAATGAAPGRQRPRVAVGEHVEPRLDHAGRAPRAARRSSAAPAPRRAASSRAPTIPITIRSAYQ